MTSTPMDKLLDQVEWQELPDPLANTDAPYATHVGVLEIRGWHFRCYQLNDGQRVIDADDVEAVFSTAPDGAA